MYRSHTTLYHTRRIAVYSSSIDSPSLRRSSKHQYRSNLEPSESYWPLLCFQEFRECRGQNKSRKGTLPVGGQIVNIALLVDVSACEAYTTCQESGSACGGCLSQASDSFRPRTRFSRLKVVPSPLPVDRVLKSRSTECPNETIVANRPGGTRLGMLRGELPGVFR